MPGIVNEDDLSALAAEYVIGTLDPDERARANATLDADEGFRALVRAWERRLGELHLMVEPVEPDGRILERIRDRLGVRAPAPPPFAPVAATPAAAPVSAPLSATTFSAPASTAPFAAAFEPSLGSKPQQVPQPPPLPPPLAPPPQPAPRTPEQQLASLIEEADKFTTQLSELASRPSLPETGQETGQEIGQETGQETGQEAGQETGEGSAPSAEAASHVESLLAEAADAIASKPRPPAESDEFERVGDAWPDQIIATEHLPPPIRNRGPRRDATMLMSPADVAHLTVRRQQLRIGRWRATALLMTFLAFGLGSLIAAWRLAPHRLPHGLQPIAVLGLGEWSSFERVPAEHGTQFEE
jgi:hypothetical protein